jgi:ParB/RepB/Spo0J family partition protein
MAERPPIKKWRLSKLKDNPEQAALFGDVSDPELHQLAELMRRDGLERPVEIRSDGTIIAGHQRVRAARLLGWKEIDVVVRTDLEAAGDAAVQAHFVTDNLVRRQLSPLARARSIRRLIELEEGRPSCRLGPNQKEALKRQIGERMGLSGRSVNRYLLVLEAPTSVQRAFDRGEITLIQAGKVALLPARDREQLNRRIRSGEPAAKAVAEALAAGGSAQGGAARSFVRLTSALLREAPLLRGRAGEVQQGRLNRQLGNLRGGMKLLQELIDHGERHAC